MLVPDSLSAGLFKMFSAPRMACNRSRGSRQITPAGSCCSSHGVPGAADGTLKQSSPDTNSGLISGPDSKSAADDSDDEEDDDDDDRLSFRIEVNRVDVLRFDEEAWWRCFEVGVADDPFEGVELACGDCPS